MKYVLAGASGYLGAALRRSLSDDGHQVVQLVRGQPRTPDQVQWDPYSGELDPRALAGADVVVNLAGANIGRPWTPRYKHTLRESRVRTTATLATAVARAGVPVFAVQCGISAYGEDRGDEVLTEESPTGEGFLADVVRLWEGATAPAAAAGVRVVSCRSGVVLAPDALAFKLIALPFRLGLGGRIGPGTQYFATVGLTDWLRAVRYVTEYDDIAGPVNVCLPDPPTNAEFTAVLASALRRPALLPVPGRLARLGAGDLAWEVLGSTRAVPARLLDAGFRFDCPDVTSLIRFATA